MVDSTREDRALKRSEARAEFRKQITEASSAGQVKISRERGRQRRSVEKAKAVQRIAERQGSEEARTTAYRARAEIATEQRAASSQIRLQTQDELNSLQRRNRVTNQAVSGATGAVTRSSIWSTIMLVASLFFLMIFIYVVVRNGEQFGGLAGSVGTFISGLSSNAPLFVASAPESK